MCLHQKLQKMPLHHGKKRKAVYPDKQGRRFSPRNHLPRTRSQNKSHHGK
ncbi:hypothetical protein Gotur_008904 [Gossypium turneri]